MLLPDVSSQALIAAKEIFRFLTQSTLIRQPLQYGCALPCGNETVFMHDVQSVGYLCRHFHAAEREDTR